MRVLIDHALPFLLAHGGVQSQIQQTRAALCEAGVDAQFLPWWEERQPVDLIHFFGPPHTAYIALARQKRIPVVATTLQSATCNRPRWKIRLQGWMVRAILALPFGGTVKAQLPWRSYREVAHNIVGLAAERFVLQTVYRVPEDRVSVVPLGLPREFLESRPRDRGRGPLVCVGTITEQKNSVPLARLAKAAGVPVLFVGRPYAEDAYWREFQSLVDGGNVQHQPFISSRAEMIQLLDACRGALVVSEFENWSLAAHEAAARGLPLLLRRQPWAVERFSGHARFFDTWGQSAAAGTLRQFYEECPSLPSPALDLKSWDGVAAELKAIYEGVLARKR